MNIRDSLQRYGLSPKDEDLPAIRDLVRREASLERRGAAREADLALLCCVQLFSRGKPEDVLLIWEAKQSGMDLGCRIDVQLLCGPGLATTKGFLDSLSQDDAQEALKYLTECEMAGDFEGFSKTEYLREYFDYFGID